MVYEVPKSEDVHALSNINFELDSGRLLTLLGPSGCGKTTLLNIIAGFLAPTDGQILLGDERVTGPGADRGMVFQQGALFEWQSVAKNISFGPRMAGVKASVFDPEVERLLGVVGLAGFGDKQVYELSGGMQQRVALARCLANDPDMMLMDEPLGALDALTREKMQGLILELWDRTQKTIIMVTHSVEEAILLGDIVFVMAPRPGRIEKVYELPFAKRALAEDTRAIKQDPEFVSVKEEILSFIWEMEEEIMGREGTV